MNFDGVVSMSVLSACFAWTVELNGDLVHVLGCPLYVFGMSVSVFPCAMMSSRK